MPALTSSKGEAAASPSPASPAPSPTSDDVAVVKAFLERNNAQYHLNLLKDGEFEALKRNIGVGYQAVHDALDRLIDEKAVSNRSL